MQFGSVWAGRITMLDGKTQQTAIKMLKAATDEKNVVAFRQEIAIVGQLENPKIGRTMQQQAQYVQQSSILLTVFFYCSPCINTQTPTNVFFLFVFFFTFFSLSAALSFPALQTFFFFLPSTS